MNGSKIKLKLNKEIGTYLPTDGDDVYGLYIFSLFITTEMCGQLGFDLFYEWMHDPEWNEAGGNIMFLRKSGTNAIIYFSDDDEKYEQDPENYSLNISMEELIKLADKWRELNRIKPSFIIITEENGKYTMEACQE